MKKLVPGKAAALFSLLCFSFSPSATAQTAGSPTVPAAIAIYNGKAESMSKCSSEPSGAPFTPAPAGKIQCGFRGKTTEVTWQFIATRAGADVYRFIRRMPVDAPGAKAETKEVTFSGERVIVFEDDLQVVVIQPPAAQQVRD